MTTPLTGAQHTIRAGEYEATVTELGAGLRSLTHRGEAVITGFGPDELPPAAAGQLLAPWPNRIDGGRYQFGGATFQLELSEAARGNAIHGLTRWANWEPTPPEPAQVAPDNAAVDHVELRHVLHGRPGYPFCLALSVNYQLDASAGLLVAVTAENAGSRPAPYGTGSHPYLTAGAASVDACDLDVPASMWLPTDARGIPSGPPQHVAGTRFDFRASRRIGDTSLDHALTGLKRDESGRARVRLASADVAVSLWAGSGYDWLQVFTGDTLPTDLRRRALAVEPMTCPPNAFATTEGVITLAPGDSVTHTWGIEVLGQQA